MWWGIIMLATVALCTATIVMVLVRESIAGWRPPWKDRIMSMVSFAIAATVVMMFTPLAIDAYVQGPHIALDDPAAQVIHSMHPNITEGITVVRKGVPMWIMWAFLNPGIEAMYLPGAKAIYVLDGDADVFTYYHEVGHHVWHTKLSQEQREAFIQHHESGSPAPTSYGQQSPSEDFAESFALWHEYGAVHLDAWRGEFLHNIYAELCTTCIPRHTNESGEQWKK